MEKINFVPKPNEIAHTQPWKYFLMLYSDELDVIVGINKDMM